ncbi:MAG: DUF47 family protein [Kiritimatiellae bacterium]|nr:DUF47 family protein [Kiritimatiellia bacterium]
MKWFRKLLGYDDKFFDLLEASAAQAQSSVTLLVDLLGRRNEAPHLDAFIQSRRDEKRINEEITEQLCKTFVTPLEREDIESLSTALYRIPKTIEKFSQKYIVCLDQVRGVDFSGQVQLLAQAVATVKEMVKTLRRRAGLEKVKAQNRRLHQLEGEADKLILELFKNLYTGRHDHLRVIVSTDLYETLEEIIDRCRDAGNVIFQIVLKYS